MRPLLASLLTLGLLTACTHATPTAAPRATVAMAAQALQPAQLAGAWRMHLTVGTHHFEDRLTLGADLAGQLEVPGRFTAPLTHVRLVGRRLSFEILADEGPTPYRVAYDGHLDAQGRYVGQATLPDSHETLGPFTADQEASHVAL
jgi:hypothetical protein